MSTQALSAIEARWRQQVRHALSADGPVSRLWPAYHPRAGQLAMAEAVAEALAGETHLLAEAGTGVGKSLAYLIPGVAWALATDQRLLVATHTKALQAQLMDVELPRLAQTGLFDRPFRWELGVGAENYLCLHRLVRAAGQETLPDLGLEGAGILGLLLDWCRGDVSGLRQEAPLPVPDRVWRQVAAGGALCRGPRCPFREDCYLRRARQRLRDADVLVVNHHLFLSHMASGHRLLPDCGGVILDEAHKLEDVAADFFSDRLGQRELRLLLTSLRPRGGRAGVRLEAELGETLRAVEAWWQDLTPMLTGDLDHLGLPPEPQTGPVTPHDRLERLAASLEGTAGTTGTDQETEDLRTAADRLRRAAAVWQRWQARPEADTVYWVEREPSSGDLRLVIAPLDVSERLRAGVFEVYASVVLTSATLTVGGDFGFVRDRLGVEPASEIRVASPFDYPAQAAIYLPTRMPDPAKPRAYEDKVFSEIGALVPLMDGGVFVLCTSHRLVREAAVWVRARFPELEILAQGEDAPARLLARFRACGRAVMLGTETFWQGVDVPGDALRGVIITRLPFDLPTHPLHRGRADRLQAQGRNAFLDYAVPRAALMLRQGFGRLIRHHLDSGVVAILDPRLQNRVWGRRFLDALPDCPVLRTHAEVAEAMRRQRTAVRGHDTASGSR